ncbi:nuclear transport factor 2 family protein [Halalkalicoccus salilacus]|uniref:nuclear transport factor 2 family protein n=1 Tax=Halalkalicoccus salilacus TaxID=3117459 RepID=UPI00300EFD1F
MNAERTVLEYYDALRAGESLHPYFAEEDGAVKFGISERLDGYEEIENGLREQTETTTDWTVESHDLVVTERERTAWFGDDVRMAWTALEDEDEGVRHEFTTRWSGCLERHEHGSRAPSDGTGDWRFVSMHVSVARDL